MITLRRKTKNITNHSIKIKIVAMRKILFRLSSVILLLCSLMPAVAVAADYVDDINNAAGEPKGSVWCMR